MSDTEYDPMSDMEDDLIYRDSTALGLSTTVDNSSQPSDSRKEVPNVGKFIYYF